MNTDKSHKKTDALGFLRNIIKGVVIGAANIVPGLSGGTIALLLHVLRRLLESIKSFDKKAIDLLLRARFRDFCQHSDFVFLLPIFIGILLGNILLADWLDYLLQQYPVQTWAFFFGLVLVSIFFVGKGVSHWSPQAVLAMLLGALIALGLTALPPARSNASLWYLFVCGIIAVSCMILPGLSGSYVLILLGNYQLIMLDGVSNLRWAILAPFLLGVVIGILAFARVLAYLLQKYHSQTVALLCGFIIGSLRSLWPWKHEILQNFGTKQKVIGYQYFVPQLGYSLTFALLMMLAGAALIVLLETLGYKISKRKQRQ